MSEKGEDFVTQNELKELLDELGEIIKSSLSELTVTVLSYKETIEGLNIAIESLNTRLNTLEKDWQVTKEELTTIIQRAGLFSFVYDT